MKKSFLGFISLALSIFVFNSCNNDIPLQDFYEDGMVVMVSASYDIGSAVPSQLLNGQNGNNRSAFPALPTGTDCFYQLTIENKTKQATEVYKSSETYEAVTFDIPNKIFTFPLTIGDKYTVSFEYRKSTGGTSSVLMSDVYENFALSSASPVFSRNFTLKPSSNGYGTVALPIECDITGFSSSDYAVNIEAKSVLTGEEANFTLNSVDWTQVGSVYRNTIKQGWNNGNPNKIPSGMYEIEIILTKKYIVNGRDEWFRIYTVTQTVNVFDNMVTDSWVRNDNYGDSIIDDLNNKLCINTSEIDNYALTHIYVDPQRQSSRPDVDGYTFRSGTIINPFTTIQQAIEYVNQTALDGKEYTIELMNDVVANNVLAFSECNITGASYGNSLIKIDYPTNKSITININGCNGKKTVNAGSNGRVLFVTGNSTENQNIVLSNLKICGGNATGANGYGGGIYVQDVGLTLNNVELVENQASKTGGAVYIKKSAVIKDSIVSGNRATDGGNGVYFDGSSLELQGTTWLAPNDAIYLVAEKKITISTNLTPKNASGVSQNVAAHIYSLSAATDSIVLNATSENLLSNNIDKFIVDNPSDWDIIPASTNKKNGILRHVFYLAGTNPSVLPAGSSSGTGKKTSPCNSLAAVKRKINNDDTLIYLDGEITDSASIEIIASDNTFTLAKLPGAATAKCNYTGSGSYISTAKSITINDVILDGTSDNASRAIETSGSNITVTLNNTKIQNFTGLDYGAGVKLTAPISHVWLKGTSAITNCSVTYSGAGIYQNMSSCDIKLQDSVYLDDQSVIKLANNGKVTITGELTPPTTNGIVANIKPEVYVGEPQIIDGTESLLENSHAKFSIVPSGNLFYIIKADGKLFEVTNYNSDMVIVRSADDLVPNGENLLINDIHMGAKNFRGTIIAPTGLEVTIYADVPSQLFTSINLGSSDGGRIIIDGSYATASGSGSPGIFYGGYSYTVTNVTVKNFNTYYSIFEVKNGTYSNVTCNIKNVRIVDCPNSTGIYVYVYAGFDAVVNLEQVSITNCNYGISMTSGRDTSLVDIKVDTSTSTSITGNKAKNFNYPASDTRFKYYIDGVEQTGFPNN